MRPSVKIQSAGIAGAVTTILVWGVSLAGVVLPPEVAAAVAVLVSVAVGYLVPDRPDLDGNGG